MKQHDKNYEAIRLQLDDSGLICNSNFEVLPSSEIITVKDITSGQFVDYYIINYYKAATDKVWRNKFFDKALEKSLKKITNICMLDLELMMLLLQHIVRISYVLTNV